MIQLQQLSRRDQMFPSGGLFNEKRPDFGRNASAQPPSLNCVRFLIKIRRHVLDRRPNSEYVTKFLHSPFIHGTIYPSKTG